MKEYILFLDESKPNTSNPYFCLAGCIIEKSHYENIVIPFVETVKENIFADKQIVLHESDIRQADKTGVFRKMRNAKTREAFWKYMRELFDKHDIRIIGVITEPKRCKAIYKSRYLNDEYFISLQIVLENYAYFLEQNNAKGSIYIESRNPVEDRRLQSHYFNLMAAGTLFLNHLSLQSHIMTLSFNMKSDNNIGLQIADFIPNAIKRHACSCSQKNPNILASMLPCLNNGGVGDISRFGVKKIY